MINIDEQIEKTQAQIKQLENKRKELMTKKSNRERNARTKRLIERGAILEGVIGHAEGFTNEQLQQLLIELLSNEEAKAKIEKARAESANKGNPLS